MKVLNFLKKKNRFSQSKLISETRQSLVSNEFVSFALHAILGALLAFQNPLRIFENLSKNEKKLQFAKVF